MRKIIILIVAIIVNSPVLFSQEIFEAIFFVDAVTSGVPVYRNDTCINSFTIIKESSEKEDWHCVDILAKSKNRYKVHIVLCNGSTATPPIDGWVEKEQCGVWLRGRYIKSGLWNVYFYKYPGQLHPFLKITSKYLDSFSEYDNDKAVPVLDYKLYEGKYWIKTVITKDKKRIVGWTKDYCPNVYGACN